MILLQLIQVTCLNEHIYSIIVIINNKIFSYIIFLIANLLKANFNAESLSDLHSSLNNIDRL
jgi:hypothetical protein